MECFYLVLQLTMLDDSSTTPAASPSRQNVVARAYKRYCEVSDTALFQHQSHLARNYTNPGYGLSLVDTLWNVGSYRQPLEQEGNPMT